MVGAWRPDDISLVVVVVVSGKERGLNASEGDGFCSSSRNGNLEKRFMARHNSEWAGIRGRETRINAPLSYENVRGLPEILRNLNLLSSMSRGGDWLESLDLEAKVGQRGPLLMLQLLVA